MEFSRQEYWHGGDLPNQGIEPHSPALQAYSLLLATPGALLILVSQSAFIHEEAGAGQG